MSVITTQPKCWVVAPCVPHPWETCGTMIQISCRASPPTNAPMKCARAVNRSNEW
ncbi:hypothetical protein tf_31 [Pseudomonas phage tf]|uniref:Uncharacterized protein n=1 Tax=Pseudomonas phage tf TaxID=1114179 RepID=J7RUM3_9CAUD|nr:hypothetical protein tf_31 [Pseudomonas phage tf]CCL97939.1 hypothetical protein tf_31 [Pseudomonas phage tf]